MSLNIFNFNGQANLTNVKLFPWFFTLQSMDYLIKGHILAEVPAVLGSLDIVFGEVDR